MAEKYIMVMADYMTDGLWHKNGTPLCDDEIKKLELDIFLLKRLNKWCDWYESNDDWSVNSKHDFEYEKFADEGLQIAKQIHKSLAKKALTFGIVMRMLYCMIDQDLLKFKFHRSKK